MKKEMFGKLSGLCLYVFLCLLPRYVVSQDCNSGEIVNLPGMYKGPGKGSTSGVAKADLDRQQAVTRKLMSMVVDNYQPKGMNISYGPAHYPQLPYLPNGVNVGNRYQTAFYLMYFYCNHLNKMEQIAETHSIIELRANEWNYPLSFFVRQHVDQEDPETDVFGTIKHKPVWNEKGYWTMTDTVYTAGQDVTHFHHLVTKNRELPFVFVTKKEYLQKLRLYYEKQIQFTVNSWKNPSPEEAEYAKSRIDGDKSFYGNSIQHIDELLVNSSKEVLNEPATLIGGGPPSEFEGFVENKYSNWVIKPNPAYYNPKAPKSTVHFIDVLFQIYEPEKACMNAKNDILKIIDFKALQEMVDKESVQITTPQTQTKPAVPKN